MMTTDTNTAATEYAAAHGLRPLTDDEIRSALREVEQGKIPHRQRDLQVMLLITYADERCVSFVLTEEGRAWMAAH